MRVGVGYSDNPDTMQAGEQAAREALAQAGRKDPCDLVLLFATSRHDNHILGGAVSAVFGPSVPIVGGGAVGAISNSRFGYAGDQIALAALWFDDAGFTLLSEPGLLQSEEETGRRLGSRMAEADIGEASPVLLFYDAIDRTGNDLRLLMATPLLEGIRQGLGFLPDIVGAGLQGDYISTPTGQWAGDKVVQHNALSLIFSGSVNVDSIIMHGCRPATGYYTVTKADRQTILEINGKKALDFLQEALGPSIPPERYPFSLILGVNQGEKWGEFMEKSYANRLCLAIDKGRGGIVMFEPDMVAGTEFQIMYRSMELNYIPPRIEKIFNRSKDREPVFALYINCAGRAAGYAGVDMEDAVVVQKTVADRVPLLGIYTGVEIASVEGRPRGLDWTGVFCLFSVPK